MVLLVAKINKLYSKLDNNLHHHHHHNQNEAVLLSASLERFFSDVFNDLNNKLSSSSSSSSVIKSFSSIQNIFELIPITNKAFAKLVVEIDHPMSKWKSDSVDHFLNYTLTLLELFNSITYSLSHLSQARLKLSHALSLKEEKKLPSSALKHLKKIEPFSLSKNNEAIIRKRKLGDEVIVKGCDKEEAIQRALSVMESLGFWVCGVVLSSLSGDEFVLKSSVDRLDSRLFKAMVEKKVEIVKEVKEVNESVDCLLAAIGNGKFGTNEAEELRNRLGVFERKLDGFGSEIDGLFKELLRRRNQLLSGFQISCI